MSADIQMQTRWEQWEGLTLREFKRAVANDADLQAIANADTARTVRRIYVAVLTIAGTMILTLATALFAVSQLLLHAPKVTP